MSILSKSSLLRAGAAAFSSLSPLSDDPLLMVGGISRSGTTLLVTVLDSHPQISLGSELLPGSIASLSSANKSLRDALEAVDGDWASASSLLKERGEKELGQFFTRCRRAGLNQSEVLSALGELDAKHPSGIHSFRERLDTAWSLMKRRWEREGTKLYGFKLNSSAIDVASALFPNAHFVCIVRDPADVMLSQMNRNFDRTPADIAKGWSGYSICYNDFASRNPDRCTVVRYEDLVRSPRRTLARVFSKLPVLLDEKVFSFYDSKSPILSGDHPNETMLRRNFSTNGIGKGWRQLSPDNQAIIKSIAAAEMSRNGYGAPGYTRRLATMARSHKEPKLSFIATQKKNLQLSRRRKFEADDYLRLLEPYLGKVKNYPICEYVREDHSDGSDCLVIRHDIDHDMETARKIAKWEARHGVRSTFCILHTAWYYGEYKDGKYNHSRELLDGVFDILSHGHEINLHNNLVTLALTEGIDPFRLLEQELEFFDLIGVPIVGTSTHGDKLCRDLNFRNWEIFAECCDEKRGGVRTVEHTLGTGKSFSFRLGQRSMREFGLEYEAYDLARDVYHTESGGHMRTRHDAPGRRDFGRVRGNGKLIGVLTHPEWWRF